MLAWEDSASALWAREVRGISSMAKAVAPVLAIRSTPITSASGFRKLTRVVLAERPSYSLDPSGRSPRGLTLRITCPSRHRVWESSMISAPADRYASSEKQARSPAPASIQTSTPFFIKRPATSGVSATRCSPGCISFTTATRINFSPPWDSRQGAPSAS